LKCILIKDCVRIGLKIEGPVVGAARELKLPGKKGWVFLD
jgi:hypothetical protein